MDEQRIIQMARAHPANARYVADVGEPATCSSAMVARDAAMLGMLGTSNTYPVEKLGPIMAPATIEIARIVQLPVEIAAQSVLAAAALAGVMAVIHGRRAVSLEDMTNAVYIAQYYIDAQVEADEFVSSKCEEIRIAALKGLLREKFLGEQIASRALVSLMTVDMGSRSVKNLRDLMRHLEDEGFVAVTKQSPRSGSPPTWWYVYGESSDRH